MSTLLDRDTFTQRDQEATRVALALDVHAIGCEAIPREQRSLIAAAVEGWLADVGMRR